MDKGGGWQVGSGREKKRGYVRTSALFMFLWTVISCLSGLNSEYVAPVLDSPFSVTTRTTVTERAGEEPDLGEKGKLSPGAYG